MHVTRTITTAPIAMGAVSLLLAGVLLGLFAAGDSVLGWDLSIAHRIQMWEGEVPLNLYRVGDQLGSTLTALICAVVGVVAALAAKRQRIAVFLVFTMLLRLAATQLKPIFESPRPTADHVRLLEHFDGSGYPSGHSTTGAMLAAMVILLALHYVHASGVRWGIVITAMIGMVLVGWSRVWAGAHWPSDVLGGWCFGIGLTLLAWLCADLILRRYTAERTAIR